MQILALTLGEPAGIGPDLALAIWRRRAELELPPFYIIGDPDFLRPPGSTLRTRRPHRQRSRRQPPRQHFILRPPVVPLGLAATAEPGRPDGTSAPAAITSIGRAVADVIAGAASAVVTNPIAKNVLYNSGFEEPGHTEFLASCCARTGNSPRPVMMLWSPEVRRRAGHHPFPAQRM